jgi:hypothetical protein
MFTVTGDDGAALPVDLLEGMQVLVVIAMPQVDGYELPKRLRSARPDGVPAVALTAFCGARGPGPRAHRRLPGRTCRSRSTPGRLVDRVARLGRRAAAAA